MFPKQGRVPDWLLWTLIAIGAALTGGSLPIVVPQALRAMGVMEAPSTKVLVDWETDIEGNFQHEVQEVDE